MISIKTSREIDLIRASCRLVADAHRAVRDRIVPGVTTVELDRLVERLIRSRGAEPAWKGYHGYPATICASVNAQVVHGVPNDHPLQNGDMVGLDIGCRLGGYYGDQGYTYPVGDLSLETWQLMRITLESLYKGIEQARPGARLADVTGAVQAWVESHGYYIVRNFVGHGIGRKLHEEPQVPNYAPLEKNPRLKPGMVFCLEPMVNMGTEEVVVAPDNWTAAAADGLPSAHFEHVVAITSEGSEILSERLEDETASLKPIRLTS
jgi:methionyl aminopeptidase